MKVVVVRYAHAKQPLSTKLYDIITLKREKYRKLLKFQHASTASALGWAAPNTSIYKWRSKKSPISKAIMQSAGAVLISTSIHATSPTVSELLGSTREATWYDLKVKGLY
jgi:hypothetical protein